MAHIWAILEQRDGILHENSGELLAELTELAQRQAEPTEVSAFILTAHTPHPRVPARGTRTMDQPAASGGNPSIVRVPLAGTLGRGGMESRGMESGGMESASMESGHGELNLLEHPLLASYTTEGTVHAIIWLLQQSTPAPLLIATSATANGRDWMPRLAARLHLPFVPACLSIDIHDASLFALRTLYDGRAYIQTRTFLHGQTALATLLPGVRGLAAAPAVSSQAHSPTIHHLLPDIPATSASERIESLAVEPPAPETVALEAAERIVAGGRGIGREGFAQIASFARLLGAAVGATRVATDRGWIEHARQIGATGKSVHPRLYIACGISGAAQHTSGMREAQTVIAINPDRSAPIFALADLGLLGDANQILPLAAEMITKSK